jgi:hypothetical protein
MIGYSRDRPTSVPVRAGSPAQPQYAAGNKGTGDRRWALTHPTEEAAAEPPQRRLFMPSSRSCYRLLLRSLGVTLFKGGNGDLEIVAPLGQRPRQYRIPDVGPVGNPGARFFGRDVGFDQLNGANKISQYLSNDCDLSYRTFARCLKTSLYVHLRAPNGSVRHIWCMDAKQLPCPSQAACQLRPRKNTVIETPCLGAFGVAPPSLQQPVSEATRWLCSVLI